MSRNTLVRGCVYTNNITFYFYRTTRHLIVPIKKQREGFSFFKGRTGLTLLHCQFLYYKNRRSVYSLNNRNSVWRITRPISSLNRGMLCDLIFSFLSFIRPSWDPLAPTKHKHDYKQTHVYRRVQVRQQNKEKEIEVRVDFHFLPADSGSRRRNMGKLEWMPSESFPRDGIVFPSGNPSSHVPECETGGKDFSKIFQLFVAALIRA